MKKVFKSAFIFTLVIFLTIIKVHAYEYSSVNISTKINVPFLQTEEGVIKVNLSSNLRDNNPNIYYQFIETTEGTISYYETESGKIDSSYRTCIEKAKSENNYEPLEKAYLALKESLGDDYETNEEYIQAYNAYLEMYNLYNTAYSACGDAYNSSYIELLKVIPVYVDSDWQTKAIDSSDDSSITYKLPIPKTANYYWLWIKAKDEENTDIYQVVRKKGSSSEEPSSSQETPASSQETPASSQTSEESSETPDNPQTGHKSLLMLLPIVLILFILIVKSKFYSKSNISNL